MVFSFAGTIASFVTDDWELVERVVDFHHLEENEHEGHDNREDLDERDGYDNRYERGRVGTGTV